MIPEVLERPRALTIMNDTGDTTITWTEDNDARMEELIKKKMAEGYRFFIVEPRMGGIVPPDTSKKLKTFSAAKKNRALSMKDDEFEKMVLEGNASFVKTPAAKVKTTRKSTDAKEIAKSESVATRAMSGG